MVKQVQKSKRSGLDFTIPNSFIHTLLQNSKLMYSEL